MPVTVSTIDGNPIITWWAQKLMIFSHRQILTWTMLFACSIIYNFYLLKIPVDFYDEGILLAGADRILKGQVPYADFWSMYPPGQYYILAFLFKIFGTSILTERLYDIVIRSLLSTSVYLIIKKLGLPYAIAIIGWGIALVSLGSFGFPAYPIYSAILLIILGAYFFVHYFETNQSHNLIYSGIFIGGSSLFRHDLAGMAAISVFLTLFLKKVVNRETGIRSSYFFIFGMSSVVLPIFIYMTNNIGVYPIINQLLLTPADIMPKYRWLPYPTFFSFSSIQFYVYPFALFLGLLASWFLIVRLRIHSSLSYGMFLLSCVGILFINQARIRSDAIHLLPTILLCAVIGPSLSFIMLKSMLKTLKPQFTKIGGYLLLVMITIPLITPIYQKVQSLNRNYFAVSKSLYRSGYASVSKDLQDLVLLIRENTDENDAIYIGVNNHDQFIANDVIVYFLADRRYATRYHELHPGVTNTIKIQNEIIQEIKNASVKIIILAPRYWYEPNDTRVDSKIDHIDHYIRDHYEMTRKFGLYEVWTRK